MGQYLSQRIFFNPKWNSSTNSYDISCNFALPYYTDVSTIDMISFYKFDGSSYSSARYTHTYVSGTITATAGTIGGCTISGGVLNISQGNIVAGAITVDKLKFSDGTTVSTWNSALGKMTSSTSYTDHLYVSTLFTSNSNLGYAKGMDLEQGSAGGYITIGGPIEEQELSYIKFDRVNLSILNSDGTTYTYKSWSDIISSSGGTTNYNDLSNKPQINGVTLSGNKTTAQLGITALFG